jgi:hypothetical protein
MDFETLFAKTPATLDEIRARVAYALGRHPLCRAVQFDIVSMPRTGRGGNWTISLKSVAPDALGKLPISLPISRTPTSSPPRPDFRPPGVDFIDKFRVVPKAARFSLN